MDFYVIETEDGESIGLGDGILLTTGKITRLVGQYQILTEEYD